VEDYIHRIGRAGRKTKDGYNKGASFTLFTAKNARMARDLIALLVEANQPVPPELERLSSSGGGFSGGGGGRGGGGGGGGRYRGGGGGGSSSGPLGPRRY
jgi:ATP-dependent RNA helicase DDX5/DBP2